RRLGPYGTAARKSPDPQARCGAAVAVAVVAKRSSPLLQPACERCEPPRLRVAGWRLNVRAARELPSTPRPVTIDLHLERETEGNPDNDDDAKDGDAFEGRGNDYRP